MNKNQPAPNAQAQGGQQGAAGAAVPVQLETDYHISLQTMKNAFKDCSDVMFRELQVSGGVKGFIVYIDGMVKTEEISDHLLLPLFHFPHQTSATDTLKSQILLPPKMSDCTTYRAAADAVLAGNAVFFVQGQPKAIVINARGGTRRGVEEPQTESVVRGPKEGFNENLRTNTSLLRFKLKTQDLKMKSMTIGERSQTAVALSYIEGVAEPKIIEEAERRLKAIQIDAILESGYIEEMIEDQPLSPFPQLQYTERPDTAAAALLEGRFAIFVDGTPFVLIGPVTFWQFMQASEDYYERYFVGNLVRWLRMFFIGVALFLPALYVAVTTYHQDMLPTTLLLSIAAARESIPFPALVEALMMEIAFEALREAGIRLPKTVGQAVSILGALVIGQSAVQAGIVSAPMVIIVSLTGIASFTIPRFNMAITIRLLRFPIMILAGVFGLFGIVVSLVWIMVHLCTLESFGVPYLSGIAPYKKKEQKDIMVRAPWWAMVFRPSTYSRLSRRRLNPAPLGSKKQPGGSTP
ncbi:spore germination protein [Gorillibacterium sp. sgz5001074]|uniref:spore germination protein n=1 Tax=Gorillibacterium sp. sgz5001074 TaxID=3446695 RepID=UPI003F663F83